MAEEKLGYCKNGHGPLDIYWAKRADFPNRPDIRHIGSCPKCKYRQGLAGTTDIITLLINKLNVAERAYFKPEVE